MQIYFNIFLSCQQWRLLLLLLVWLMYADCCCDVVAHVADVFGGVAPFVIDIADFR